MRRSFIASTVFAVVMALAAPAQAAPGALLATVDLPGNSACSVGGTFDGTYYIVPRSCPSDTIDIYTPPPGTGAATLVATKTLVDSANNPVFITTNAWDPSRNMMWGAHADTVYLTDLGDKTVSGTALTTFEFTAGVGGFDFVDGLEWDGADDTLYYSPDVSCNVYHFSPTGTLLNTVTPKNAAGAADCGISGVEVGAGNSLYIGRDGAAEIRRVDKTTGAFISQFATTSGRVEELTCDPVTYAPLEAILAKDAFAMQYEAFEVEPGTCPADRPPEPAEITLDPKKDTNPVGTDHTVTATVTSGGNPVQGAQVQFTVISGPNAGQQSDPGECSTDPNCVTDANGQTSWTYTSNGTPGTDVIEACITDATGARRCAKAEKTWELRHVPEGRMTGGGSVLGSRVTHGFELHCDTANLPNRLEVNWGKGNNFHLTTLRSVRCTDEPSISEGQPVAGFDTYEGTGDGVCNGLPATARWRFTDEGEPGTSDKAEIDISGGCTLSVSGKLQNGNHQAHPA